MAEDTPAASATLYAARLTHRRHRPKAHDFGYDLWALKVDLAQLDELAAQNLLGGTSPLSLSPKDFGPRNGSDLLTWARTHLGAEGPYELVFLPRLRGRGFSPISVWMSPSTLMFEVHNTAGEAHSYAVPRHALAHHQAWKRLWVSPFSHMLGTYAFGLRADTTRLNLHVRLRDADGPILDAVLAGPGQPLTAEALGQLIATPGISGAWSFRMILWQALKLRLKGLRPHWGPFAPAAPISRSHSTSSPEDTMS